MKKYISILSIAIIFAACNSSGSATSIDFTQSYEKAALALETAQSNFSKALETKDVTQIQTAKVALESATAEYVKSKTAMVQNGGSNKVKAEYETALTNSNNSLKDVAVSNILSTVKTDTATAASTTATTGVKAVDSTVSKAKSSVVAAQTAFHNKVVSSKHKIDSFALDGKSKIKHSFDKIKENNTKRKKDIEDVTNKLKGLFQ